MALNILFMYNKRYYFSDYLIKEYNLPANNGIVKFYGSNIVKFLIKNQLYTFNKLKIDNFYKHFSEKPFIKNKKEIVIYKKFTKFNQFLENEEEKDIVDNNDKIDNTNNNISNDNVDNTNNNIDNNTSNDNVDNTNNNVDNTNNNTNDNNTLPWL